MTIQQAHRPDDPVGTGDSMRFIGNATVLLQYGGLTILTDPNFIHAGEEIPLGYGLTTRRLTDPAMEIEDLPPLDLVLLSHWHTDHFDRIAEARLDRSVPILTTPQAAAELQARGFREARGLETWETEHLRGADAEVRITAMPGRHAPGALSIALPDVMGSLVQFGSAAPRAATSVGAATGTGTGAGTGADADLTLYITGDTLVYDGLGAIRERHPSIDLALLHLGGTRVMGVTVTMDAAQGVELLQLLEPGLAVPIHYDDYEAFKSPLEDFVQAVADAGLAARVRYVARGEVLGLPAS